MNDNKFLKIFSLVAFLIFAYVSCWATAESLHLLLSSWPVFMCWAVTVGFFFIASWGSKMIVDSLNQDVWIENHGMHLVGGIIILLVFWLCCSMPTNTHTFFYRSVISSKVSSDIQKTQSYLGQIKANQFVQDSIKRAQSDLENKVRLKLGELEAEIQNGANPGNGPAAKQRLRELANLLDVPSIQPLSGTGSTKSDRDKLVDAYRQKILNLLDVKKQNIASSMQTANNNHINAAKAAYEQLVTVKNEINNGELDLNDAHDVKTVCDVLNVGYAVIGSYSQFVGFANDIDKNKYTSPNAVTDVDRMISVFDVWKDFLRGEYAGRGFWFWVLISVLVDVASFIFFDIAFKKRD